MTAVAVVAVGLVSLFAGVWLVGGLCWLLVVFGVSAVAGGLLLDLETE